MLTARTLTAACVMAVLVAGAALAGVASAAPPQASSAAGEAHTARGQATSGQSKAQPHLTTGECQGLGGKAVPKAGCASTFGCRTVDKNGVVHEACINAPNH